MFSIAIKGEADKNTGGQQGLNPGTAWLAED
jgi:hypothetical protein